MNFKDRMYPAGNMTEKFQIDEDTYDIEFAPPKWNEVMKAESRATIALKDVLSHPMDKNGIPLPMPPHEQRLLNMQTGIELAKVCVVRVGDISAAEPGFWDRLPVPVITALGGIILAAVWDTEVGRKNSQKPSEPQRILRKLRAPVSPQVSATLSSDGSTSSVSCSAPDTPTPT